MRKGKQATTASHQKDREEQNSYVPKTRKRRDPRLVGDSSQSQIDYSSRVVDPTQAHEYVEYAGGFEVYNRMQEEAEDEEVAEDEDAEADYLEADDIVPEPEPEPRQRRLRAPLIPSCPVVGPPFPGGPETTHLLSDYARHVAILLWVNHLNAIGKWSWEEMTLAYLYDYLNDSIRLNNKTMAGCVTLLTVRTQGRKTRVGSRKDHVRGDDLLPEGIHLCTIIAYSWIA
nr:hypothetical protein MtrDRAFT_AC158464g19v2 [Medicago truncatula]